MSRVCRVLVLLAAFLPSMAAAQKPVEPAPVLREQEVLASVAEHFPEILGAIAARRGAEGGLDIARGAFDLNLEGDSYSRLSGFWDGKVAGVSVRKPLETAGAEIFGGYRVSRGAFPIYEDINFTDRGGEFKAGIALPLLRDRDFDARRFGLADARLDVELAEARLFATRLDVHAAALAAWYGWVAAALRVAVYEDLLGLAALRDDALAMQVAEGDAADILLIENRQNVIRREAFLLEARRDLDMAGLALSFYLRDGEGQPREPRDLAAPAHESFVPEKAPPAPAQVLRAQARERRPELALVETAIDKARQRLRLADNAWKPELDLRYELSRDIGATGVGGISRDSTDNTLAVTFRMPLERSRARGERQVARAEIERLEFERRRLEDRIAIEIESLIRKLEAADGLRDLATEEVAQAETMQRAETVRFEEGASSFFIVNRREEIAAEASIKRIVAALDYHLARAELARAAADTAFLGIPPE